MPIYSDKTYNENIQNQVDDFQNEALDREQTVQNQADVGEQVSNQLNYEAGRDYEIAQDNKKIKDTKPQEDTGKVAEYWNKSLDFLGAPESLRANEVHNGRSYDARNKRPSIYADYSKEDLINEVKNVKEDPNAKHVLYNIKYYVGKDKYGDSKYAYKTGVDSVSAFNRYKDQLGNNVQIVFEKRFAGAEDAENRFHQLESDNGTQLASNQQEAFKQGIGSFGSGYTEFTNQDYFNGDEKDSKDFKNAFNKSEKEYSDDMKYRATHNSNNSTWDIIKGGDYTDALESGTMSLVGGIGDAIASGVGFGLNELGLRNNLADTNWFNKLKNNADKYSGYDRRSSTQAMVESTNLWNKGHYVQALWNNKADLSDSIVESLPEMLTMTVGLPESGAIKLVKGLNEANKALRVAQEAGDIKKVSELSSKVEGLTAKFKDLGEEGIKVADTVHNLSLGRRITNVMKREAGFEAVVSKNTNNVIENRLQNGDDDISTGEFAGVLATQFLSTATDRFAFKEIAGDSKVLGALKDAFKVSNDEVKKGIVHKIASTALSLGTAGVVEGVQEYLQTWSEITGAQLGVKGKTLDEVLSDKSNQNQAIGASIAGAVGGVAMHGAIHGAKGAINIGKKGVTATNDLLKRNNINLDTSEEEATQINSVDDFNNDELSPESKMMSIGLHLDESNTHSITGIESNGLLPLVSNILESVKHDDKKTELFKEFLTQKLADKVYNNNKPSNVKDLLIAKKFGLDIDGSMYNKALDTARDIVDEVVSEKREEELNKSINSQGSETIGDNSEVTPDEGFFEDYRVKNSEPSLNEAPNGKKENPLYGKFDSQILSLNRQIQAMKASKLDTKKTEEYRDSLIEKNSEKYTPLKSFQEVIEDIQDLGFRDSNGNVDPDKQSLNYYNKSLPLSVSSFGYDENHLLNKFVGFTKSRINKADYIKKDTLASKVIEENKSLLGIAIKALATIENDSSLTSKQKEESTDKVKEAIESIQVSNRALLDRALDRNGETLDSKESNPELAGSYVVGDEAVKQLILKDLTDAKTTQDIEVVKNKIKGAYGTLPVYFNNKDGSDILLAIEAKKTQLFNEKVKSQPTTLLNNNSSNNSNSNNESLPIENNGTNVRTDYGKINFVSTMRNFLTSTKTTSEINPKLFKASVKSLLTIKDPQTRESISKKLSSYALTDAQIGVLYDALNYNKQDYSDEVTTSKNNAINTKEEYRRLDELHKAIKTLKANILLSNKNLKSEALKEALGESNKELQELTDEIVAIKNSLHNQEKNLAVDDAITKKYPDNKYIRALYLKGLKIIKSLYQKLLNISASREELNTAFNYLQKTVTQIDRSGKINKLSIEKTINNLNVIERTITKRLDNLKIPTIAYRNELKIASDLEKHSNPKISKFAKNVKKKLLKEDGDHTEKIKAFKKLNEFVKSVSKNPDKNTDETSVNNVDKEDNTNSDDNTHTNDDSTHNSDNTRKDSTTSNSDNTNSDKGNPKGENIIKNGQYSAILSFLFNTDTNTLPKSFKWSKGLPDASNEAIPQEWNTKATHELLNQFKVNFNEIKVLLSKDKNDSSNQSINKTLEAMKQNTLDRLDALAFDLKNNERKTHDKLVAVKDRKDKLIPSLEKQIFNLHKSLKYQAKRKDIPKFYATYKKILKKEILLQSLIFKKSSVNLDNYKEVAMAYAKSIGEDIELKSLETKHNNKISILASKMKSTLKLARIIVRKFFNQKKRILERINTERKTLDVLNDTISTFNVQNKISDEAMDYLESKFLATKVKDSIDTRTFSNGERLIHWFGLHNPNILQIFEVSNNPISKISNLLTSGKKLTQIEEEYLHENMSDSSFDKLKIEDLNNMHKLTKLVNGFVGSKEGNTEVDNGSFFSTNGVVFNIANMFRRVKSADSVSTQGDFHRVTKLVNGLTYSALQEMKFTILKMDNDDITKNFHISGDANIRAFKHDVINNRIPLASIREDLSNELRTLIGIKVKKSSDEKNNRLYDATLKTIIESVLQESPMFSLETKQYSATQSYKLVTLNNTMLEENFSEEDLSDIRNSFSKLSYIAGVRKKNHPSHKPYRVTDKIHNGVVKLMKQDIEKLTKLNNTPYVYSDNFKSVAEVYENDKELAYSMVGMISDEKLSEMNIEDYTTAKSVNEQTKRDLDNLYKYYSEFKDKEFYLPYGVTKSNRTQIFSDITPMDSKMHREFIIKKPFINKISPNIGNYREPIDMVSDTFSDEEEFEIALSEAFDLDPDKKSRFQLFSDIRNIVDIYATDGVKIKDSKHQFIKEFIENPIEDLSILDTGDWSTDIKSFKRFHAILELRKLHQSKVDGNQTITHDLTLEADAITSGTGILTLQSGLSDENKQLMEKAGILNDEQLRHRLAYTKKLLAHKHNVSEDDIDMTMPSLIEAGDYHYSLIVDDSFDTSSLGIPDEDVYLDIYKTMGSDVMQEGFDDDKIDGEESSFDVRAFKMAKDDLIALALSKGLSWFRQLSKPPVMTFNYGSAISSIKKDIREKTFDAMFIDSLRGDNKYANLVIITAHDRAKKVNRKGWSKDKNKEYNKKVIADYWSNTGRNFFIPEEYREDINLNNRKELSKYAIVADKSIIEVLQEQADVLLGNKFETSFDNRMKTISKYREALRNMDVIHAETFKFLFEEEIANLKATKKVGISKEEQLEFAERAKTEDLQELEKEYQERSNKVDSRITAQDIANILDEMNADGLGYTLSLFNRIQEFYKTADEKQDAVERSYFKGDGQKDGISYEAQVEEFISNFRAYPTTSIHNIDDEQMRRALLDNDFSSIYDAIIFPSKQKEINKTTDVYNNEMIHTNRDNSIMTATVAKLNVMLGRIRDLGLEDKFYDRFNMFDINSVPEIYTDKVIVANHTDPVIGIYNGKTANNRKLQTLPDRVGTRKVKTYTIKMSNSKNSFSVSQNIKSKKGDNIEITRFQYSLVDDKDNKDSTSPKYNLKIIATGYNFKERNYDFKRDKLVGEISNLQINPESLNTHEGILDLNNEIIGDLTRNKVPLTNLHTEKRHETALRSDIALKENSLHDALKQVGFLNNGVDFKVAETVDAINEVNKGRDELSKTTLHVNHMAILGTQFKQVDPSESNDNNRHADVSTVKELLSTAQNRYIRGTVDYLTIKYPDNYILKDISNITDGLVDITPIINNKDYMDFIRNGEYEKGLEEYQAKVFNPNVEFKYTAEINNGRLSIIDNYKPTVESIDPVEPVIPISAMDIIEAYLNDPDRGC